MKALKYGLTLILGLGMLGFGTRLQAQTSGQTADVVPANATPLADIPVMTLPTDEADEQPAEEQPQRGMPTPQAIEDMVSRGEYAQAVAEFEKYMKTASGNPCDLLYLPYTFYDRLRIEDTAKADVYQGKVKIYVDKFLKTCGNTVEAYVLRDDLNEPRVPEQTIELMTKAIELEPEYVILYSRRASAFWELERTKEACADFKKAAELKEEFSASMYKMYCVSLEGNAE